MAFLPVCIIQDGRAPTTTPMGTVTLELSSTSGSLQVARFSLLIRDRVWGIYGPIDAFNLDQNWFAPIYIGLNQAPIAVMIENYRTGLIWKLFMSNPEIQPMLDKISAPNSPRKAGTR